MIKTLYILTIALALFGCSTKQDKLNEVSYIIEHHNEAIPNTKDEPPPPPSSYYGNFNFILLDSAIIYFHYRPVAHSCGFGVDRTKPPRLFLTPDSLTILNNNTLPQFLMTSLSDSLASIQHVFASISSPTDTIKNSAFKTITDFFKAKKIRTYVIRHWTEEEQLVTTAKMENKKYNPYSIDWKVGFDFTRDELKAPPTGIK